MIQQITQNDFAYIHCDRIGNGTNGFVGKFRCYCNVRIHSHTVTFYPVQCDFLFCVIEGSPPMHKVIFCLGHFSVEDHFFYFGQVCRIEGLSCFQICLHLGHVEGTVCLADVFHYNFSGHRHACIER